jgi:hypothetical protein
MLEGQWYSVDYTAFAGYLGISEDELRETGFTLRGFYLLRGWLTCIEVGS